MRTMKKYEAKRHFGGLFFAVIFLALSVFFMGGCGGGDDDPVVEGPAIKKAYYIGDVREGLAPNLKKRCVHFLPYDGKSTDGVLFVSYRKGFTPNEDDVESIRRVYEAGRFVALVHASIDQVNEFLGHIGLPPHFDILESDEEGRCAEIFAVNKRPRDNIKSDIFTWVTPAYVRPDLVAESSSTDDPVMVEPELPDEEPDMEELNETKARNFVQYVEDEDRRLREMETARESAQAAISSATNDLTQIAQAQHHTFDASAYSQNFQLHYFIYACHSYNEANNTDYDWFVVQQRAVLNPSNKYVNKDHGDGYLAQIYGYMVNYEFENWFDYNNKNSTIHLMNSSPATTTGSSSTTSGFSWNLGGNIGVTPAGPSMAISGGISFSSSESVVVTDCTVTNKSAPSNDKSNAYWNYSFPRPTIKPTGGNPFDIGDFHDAVLLSRSTFQPYNQWLWKIAPAARDTVNAFKSRFAWRNGNSYGNQLVWWVEAIKVRHEDWLSGNNTYVIPLIYPPLIAGNGVDFEAKGSHKRFEFATARDWTAESDQEWCTLSSTSGVGNQTGDVFVTVDPNETGADRWANITLKTTDGKGSFTVKVFQSRY